MAMFCGYDEPDFDRNEVDSDSERDYDEYLRQIEPAFLEMYEGRFYGYAANSITYHKKGDYYYDSQIYDMINQYCPKIYGFDEYVKYFSDIDIIENVCKNPNEINKLKYDLYIKLLKEFFENYTLIKNYCKKYRIDNGTYFTRTRIFIRLVEFYKETQFYEKHRIECNNKQAMYKICETCFRMKMGDDHNCDEVICNKYDQCTNCYKSVHGFDPKHICKLRPIEEIIKKKIPKIIPMFPSFKKRYIEKNKEKITNEFNNSVICYDLLNIVMMYVNPFFNSKTYLIHKFLL